MTEPGTTAQVRVGQIYEQANPPPGYGPHRVEVVRIVNDRWVFIVLLVGKPSQRRERPCPIESLLDPKLYTLVKEAPE